MSRVLYEIWEETDTLRPDISWRAQLVNYVGNFRSKEAAEEFVSSIRKHREKELVKKS